MKSITFLFTFSFALIFSNSILAQAEMSPDEMAIHKVIEGIEDA